MDTADYRIIIKSMRVSKRLGQNFLVDSSVAHAEAEYARGRAVLELGAGLGILTEELCRVARRVVAVEYDSTLFEFLSHNLKGGNLKLVKGDFFKLESGLFGDPDIMVSNIPYNLSSKALEWLGERSMPAVLCMQKEFVERMLAAPGSREYSKLSVVTRLRFKVYQLMKVPADRFYPMPKVDSLIAYLKPNGREISRGVLDTVNLLMMHKKKKIRNAIMDSAKALGVGKDDAAEIARKIGSAEVRAFQMEPEAILETAERVNNLVRSQKE
jgi:16S rRNA (adenine1518-N6/adenine1519-N6)-dimethyltransferase